MSRKDEFNNVKNPSVKFADWKSNEKTLTYFDKEKTSTKNPKGTEVKIKLPFEFVILKEMHTIRGYHEASNSQIFANQVEFTSNQELTVQSRGKGLLAKGLYQDIKANVKEAGGKYIKVLYVMDKDGQIITIHLKGSSVKVWGEFTYENRDSLVTKFISITGAKDEKKGTIVYSTPIFEVSNLITDEEDKMSETAYNSVQSYIDSLNIKEISSDNE
jgi:hypothetical protein